MNNYSQHKSELFLADSSARVLLGCNLSIVILLAIIVIIQPSLP